LIGEAKSVKFMQILSAELGIGLVDEQHDWLT